MELCESHVLCTLWQCEDNCASVLLSFWWVLFSSLLRWCGAASHPWMVVPYAPPFGLSHLFLSNKHWSKQKICVWRLRDGFQNGFYHHTTFTTIDFDILQLSAIEIFVQWYLIFSNWTWFTFFFDVIPFWFNLFEYNLTLYSLINQNCKWCKTVSLYFMYANVIQMSCNEIWLMTKKLTHFQKLKYWFCECHFMSCAKCQT